MKSKKLYVAYGSNLDVKQMCYRCPDARIIGAGFLKDYELIYRGSKSGAYASVRQAIGKYVPVGVWQISSSDEKRLDIYEGFPTFYLKYTVPVSLRNSSEVQAMIYIMRPGAKAGCPSERYVDTIYRGYKDFDLDFRFLADSLRLNMEELHASSKRFTLN